jgi:polar amino acid transport system substrate-binding protein
MGFIGMNINTWILLFLSIIISGKLLAQEELHLANDPWPPYTSNNLPNKGLATNIVQVALSKAGFSSIVSFVPWERALKGTIMGLTYRLL